MGHAECTAPEGQIGCRAAGVLDANDTATDGRRAMLLADDDALLERDQRRHCNGTTLKSNGGVERVRIGGSAGLGEYRSVRSTRNIARTYACQEADLRIIDVGVRGGV